MVNFDKHKIFHIIEIICQQILAVFVLIIFWEVWKSYDLSSLRAWHILLSVSGIALYVAEGVMLFNRESIFFMDTPRADRIVPHGVIMALGFLHLLVGIALRIKVTSDNPLGSHFSTTHAILGLVTLIIMFVVLLGGLLAASRFMAGQKSIIKIIHLLLGISAYLLGIISLGFGLNYMTSERGRNALIVLMSIFVIFSLKGPIMSLFGRLS